MRCAGSCKGAMMAEGSSFAGKGDASAGFARGAGDFVDRIGGAARGTGRKIAKARSVGEIESAAARFCTVGCTGAVEEDGRKGDGARWTAGDWLSRDGLSEPALAGVPVVGMSTGASTRLLSLRQDRRCGIGRSGLRANPYISHYDIENGARVL